EEERRARPLTVTVTAASLSLSALSLLLLVLAISTDHWHETDTRAHKRNCDRAGADSTDQKNRDEPIFHLPLVDGGGPRGSALRPVHVGSREDELLENWRAILGMGILETECGRPLFSTTAGLWRKCYVSGKDPDIDKLILRGKQLERCTSQWKNHPSRTSGTCCVTGRFLGMSAAVLLCGAIVASHVSGLLFLPVSLVTYTSSVDTSDLSRTPPFIYGLPSDVEQNFGCVSVLRRPQPPLTVASGAVAMVTPCLRRPRPTAKSQRQDSAETGQSEGSGRKRRRLAARLDTDRDRFKARRCRSFPPSFQFTNTDRFGIHV
uniref:Transmembrane protein 178A n=1 Tax=Neogobius melanostomus TaxID=47308 RepID=A0A8C6SGT8_9GOBI